MKGVVVILDKGCETDVPDTSEEVVTQQQFMHEGPAPNLMSHSYRDVYNA